MKPSQIAWLASLVAFVCTSLVAETEVLSPAAHRWINVVSIIATAISAFMLKRPEALGGEAAYFVVRENEGVVRRLDKREFEQHAKDVAGEMPPPLEPITDA